MVNSNSEIKIILNLIRGINPAQANVRPTSQLTQHRAKAEKMLGKQSRPNKQQEMLTRCCSNVSTPSTMLVQLENNIG